MQRATWIWLTVGWSWAAAVLAAEPVHVVDYPASTVEGELQLAVTYRLWLPEGVKQVRGVIVHQHGCGEGACKGGETAAEDLHWQALARKWDCALMGPRYHQAEGQNCRLWCDPRNGSRTTFLRALDDFAQTTGHPELNRVPWCLWGHSGGGFWASLMQASDPERIVAIWLRSGTALTAWEKGEIPTPTLSDAVYAIPVMSNPGIKERDDKRFATAWTGGWSMFNAYRAHGAPFGFAPDPRTGHECGDSRYLAIPFFDACLKLRLPDDPTSTELKAIDPKAGWRGVPLTSEIYPAANAPETATVWLPNEDVARAWAEYVQVGAVSDTTPPPTPADVAVKRDGTTAQITWTAVADPESGIGGFIIERDGVEVAKLPEKPVARFGRPLWQGMSYHDTPEPPLAAMIYTDTAATPTAKYVVRTVNSVGLKSEAAEPATTK